MAALPYMQLYIAEYLADTAHLTAIQHGAYLLLIMNYWQRGKPLKNDNGRLANVARMSNDEWEKHRDVLAEFFEISAEEWVHKRIEKDLATVNSKSMKAKAAGQASANKRQSNERSAYVERTFNHTDTDTDTEREEKENLIKEKPAPNVLAGEDNRPEPNAPSAEKPKSERTKPKSETQLPENWRPNDAHRDKCRLLGFSADDLAEEFRNYHLARANRFADWDRAFWTWIGNAKKFDANTSGRRNAQSANPSIAAAGLRVADRYRRKDERGLRGDGSPDQPDPPAF